MHICHVDIRNFRAVYSLSTPRTQSFPTVRRRLAMLNRSYVTIAIAGITALLVGCSPRAQDEPSPPMSVILYAKAPGPEGKYWVLAPLDMLKPPDNNGKPDDSPDLPDDLPGAGLCIPKLRFETPLPDPELRTGIECRAEGDCSMGSGKCMVGSGSAGGRQYEWCSCG